MKYRIELTPAAHRDFKGLPREILRRIDSYLLALAEDPLPTGSKKLAAGKEQLFRIRVGDYRIVYTVEHHRLVVLVIRIGHRREVYRG